MQKLWMTGEPSFDELLGDEIMHAVARSAGLSREELRLKLLQIARGLAVGRSNNRRRQTCCEAPV